MAKKAMCVRHEHFLLCGLDKCRVGKEEKQLVANALIRIVAEIQHND